MEIKINKESKEKINKNLRNFKHILILETIKNLNYSPNDKKKILNSIIKTIKK